MDSATLTKKPAKPQGFTISPLASGWRSPNGTIRNLLMLFKNLGIPWWAAAGFVDTDLSFLSFLELYRADVAERE